MLPTAMPPGFATLLGERYVPITRRTFLTGVAVTLGATATRAHAWAPGSLRSPFDDFLGESPAISVFRKTARRFLAALDGRRVLPPVLIVGETGSGKNFLGEILHRAGPRRGNPFVPVCIAAIPETLVESELGAWQDSPLARGARRRPGLIQAAHQGTLLVSEVDQLPPWLGVEALQKMACTAGADVWLMGTTNREVGPLPRSHGVVLRIPPLRQRGDDVLLLAEHYLARFSKEHRIPATALSAGERAELRAYPWPGNVREVMNVMERRLVLMHSGMEPGDLGLRARRL